MSIEQEKAIFLSALDRASTEQRAEYVAQQCGKDDALRKSVEALLATHDQSSLVLDESCEPHARLQRQVRVAADALGLKTSFVSGSGGEAGQVDRTGETIDSYRLMEKLGEGGFGQVYVAAQREPVRRRVAIKLLKPGMESREVIARFEAERQALAMMNHSNIAQVYDAGRTNDGQLYFVMELVRGVPITTFCLEKKLTIRETLQLFVTVCQAIHHAHQKGVIHRDLKPSNVMVTLYDTIPVVKVIDFGVAKALHEPLTDKTIYTRLAQLIGTPMYMSPEQAEMNALDVDTRSDIYSLGVLLYELLTETTPFDQQRLSQATFDEMRRMIREEEPPRPSFRLTTISPGATTKSLWRGHDAREVANQLRGDLDWIVMKALDKDRRRRYDTAADLARDVERYLQQQPVVARPPSTWYRFTKFARRNKIALATASLVLLSMVAGTTVSTLQAIRATQAKAEAEQLRSEAVDFAERLKAANILLDSARANADQQRWTEAFAQYTKATELQPDHYLTWSGRGSLYARLGAWRLATADYARALQLGAPANNPAWWGVPQLCVYAEDAAAYGAICAALQQQLADTDDAAPLISAVRGLCLQSIDESRATVLADRMDSLLSRTPNGTPPAFTDPDHQRRGAAAGPVPNATPDRGQPLGPRTRPDFGVAMPFLLPPRFPRELIEYAAAVAHFRAGDLERSIELLESVTARPGFLGARLADPVLAMAYDGQGQVEDAKKMLKLAQREHDDWVQGLLDKTSPLPWFDGLEAYLMMREAHEKILGETFPHDPRLIEYERQAVSAISAP